MAGNIRKVMRYFKKNGIVNTMYAVIERVFFTYYKDYTYKKPEKPEKEIDEDILFSIVVPTYETNENHLKEMIESVQKQWYKNWELILADASSTAKVREAVEKYSDARINYVKLAKNGGISENTNEGILIAKGAYIGLLDHDDLLTEDALYEVASKIKEEKNAGKVAKVIFSDEDKCNNDGSAFFEPHFKPGYNKELLLTNNYICHFLVCKAEMMKELLLRKEYDGAQDFDFVLRATSYVNKERKEGKQVSVCHIGKILYHWRCHENSTAENPESKMYAYEAGKRAVKTQYESLGRKYDVKHGKHLGFYQPDVSSVKELFEQEHNVGIVGGAVYKRNKVVGGAMDEAGNVTYKGLHKMFEGYMNRAHLMQNTYAVDIRNVVINDSLKELYEAYMAQAKTRGKRVDYKAISLQFCEKVRNLGYEIVYWEP